VSIRAEILRQGDREVIPLSQRPIDIAIVAFFLVNLLFITYVVDLEQLVIANPAHFTYPLWPPRPAVDAIHWWGRTFDHLQDARPVWWKMTIWIDDLLYGPFYAIAIYAFVKGKEWIRIPSVFYAGMLFATVVIILGEEKAGPYASPNFAMVLFANLPWLLFPIVIAVRMWGSSTPFTRATTGDAPAAIVATGSATGQVSGTGGA
jgi:EXPERA (EXPanded EBP superfamily)